MYQVKKIHVEKRENPIVNRLNKTKVEKFPDLRQERETRQQELRKRDRDAQQTRVSNSPFETSSLALRVQSFLYCALSAFSGLSRPRPATFVS